MSEVVKGVVSGGVGDGVSGSVNGVVIDVVNEEVSEIAMANWHIDKGQLIGVRQLVSPNFNQRPQDAKIKLLVIHNISLPAGCFGTDCVTQFFQNKLDTSLDPSLLAIQDLQVSAHLFIDRLGQVTQFVNFEDRAWHAGVSSFLGEQGCNDFSIGIELEGTDFEAFSEVQYQVLAVISRLLEKAYPLITPESTLGHSDIAPGRKTDPGPFFDWHKYKAYWKQC